MSRSYLLPIALIVGVFVAFAGKSASALTTEWQSDDAVRVRLVSGVDAVGTNAVVPLGLDVEMGEGWHTYWRSPGMAGLPPQVDWQDSLTDDGNLKSAELLYPAPRRYTAYGLETIGYRNHVLFPIDARLRIAGKPLKINAAVSLLVCSSVCVPKNFTLALAIPAGPTIVSSENAVIEKFREQLPTTGTKSGLLIKSIRNDGDSLTVDITSRDPLKNPDLFIESENGPSFKSPETTVASDERCASLHMVPADIMPEGKTFDGMPLTFTVVNGDQAMERHIVGPHAMKAALPAELPAPLPRWVAILCAVLGGFILNFMPCVLPVLSLKILSAIGHGGGETRAVRRSFLITAAGILFSFAVLGVCTLTLKVFGHNFGWGLQFQQPAFLMFLVILLAFFAANLWGFFEINLPGFVADSVQDATYHPKLAGDFASGAFATLLATPCSAPFLGTAIGFALASGSLDIVLIFLALGFGMSMPYLAIALQPRLATSMPKPGQWMITLRRILSLALLVTGLWLLWVLAAQITASFSTFAGMCTAAIIMMIALGKKMLPRWLTGISIVVLMAMAFGLTWAGASRPKVVAEVDKLWEPFSENGLAAEIAENKTVFVDVTADWCLTCKANKRFVLSQEKIVDRLFHSNVVAIQADWTNPDPVISDFLHKYRRYGIPFNVVFGPGAPEGIVLPELLTPDLVLEALDKAEAAKP